MQKPELMRIMKELSSKVPYEQKERAAQELEGVFYKYLQISDEIFTRLQKMINSQDINEKYGGILALE